MTDSTIGDKSGDSSKSQSTETKAVAFFLMSIIFAIITSAALYVISSPQLSKFARFEATVQAVISEYPDEIDADEFFENASDEIYGTLDRYSRYAPAASYNQVVEEYSGAYAGLGVSIVSQSGGLLVASVNPDGPAIEAGIKMGDVIFQADSTSLAGMTTREASLILRGKEGEPVTVGFLRPKQQTTLAKNRKGNLTLSVAYDTTYKVITRLAVPLRHVTLYGVTPNNTLYIKLNDYGAGASEQFEEALDSLLKAYPDNNGIIIDLRNNPGGLLSEALKLADYFLPDNTLLLGEKGKSRWSRREFHGWSEDQTDGAPIVIMVNRYSASASEVFSGALKFAGRAKMFGDTTFGKGLIQSYNSLPDGSASKLTVGRYYFTGEQYLNKPGAAKVDSGSGIAPDIYYQFSANDPFIQALSARMLFTKFVARYQDGIIGAYGENSYDDVIREFQQTVSESGFDYRSELLERANSLYLVSTLYQSDRESRRLSNKILQKAEELEGDVFKSRQNEIMKRLTQLAFERRDGEKAAFIRVTLPKDPDISACERILQEEDHSFDDTTKVGI